MGAFVEPFAASEEDGEAMTLVVRAAAIARPHLTSLVGMTMAFDSGMAMRIVTR